MRNEINLIDSYKKSFITFLILPLLFIGCIYISYGDFFDKIIMQQTEPLKFYQLQVQLEIFFQFDNSQVPIRILPLVTASIGYYSVISIYLIFTVWLVLFAISSYLKLSKRAGSKIIILLEAVLILAIYIISISPKLNFLLSIVGYIIISAVLVMLSLYWVYEIKLSNEKK